DANGDVAAGEQTVVYVYKAKEDPTKDVITKYVDEDGNILSRTEDGSKPKKDISGYEYVKTVVDKDGNTTHIYKKTNPVDSSKNVKSLSSPKTGDGLNGSTYAFVLLASGAILIAIGVKRKKEEV
ncbi:MucBP domain-containing protein, partial [Peptoniphilaceae bacterium SGI.137]